MAGKSVGFITAPSPKAPLPGVVSGRGLANWETGQAVHLRV